jgi:protein-L-isoaspartate(D-aspartate) O-methyltransferase
VTGMSKPPGVCNATVDYDRAAQLRMRMVNDLIAEGTIVSAPVEAAMRKVRRELFVPGVDLREVYRLDSGVVAMRDANGGPISSVSAPRVQAHMLEQAEITAGMRVLEIGSGGYNAALLAELVRPWGRVTTVDINEDVAGRASRLLADAGYSRVNVVPADAEFGVPEHAPYDRILVTADAWDIPPAWMAQLNDGGRLVVPLRVGGLSRTLAFEHGDWYGYLVSQSSGLFEFEPMRGKGAHQGERLVLNGGEVTLHFDERFVEPGLLEGVLDDPRVEVWSGATIGRFEPWTSTHMWLATALPGFCRITVDRRLGTGLVFPPGRYPTAMAVVAGRSLACITTRSTVDDLEVEFGVNAFGPDAAELAEEVAAQLRFWEREHRNGPDPQFRVYPVGTPDCRMPEGRAIDKRHSRISISWPQPVTRR